MNKTRGGDVVAFSAGFVLSSSEDQRPSRHITSLGVMHLFHAKHAGVWSRLTPHRRHIKGGKCSSALSLRIDCNNWRHHRSCFSECNERQTRNNVQLSAETEPCFISAFYVRWKVTALRPPIVCLDNLTPPYVVTFCAFSSPSES